MDVAGFMCTLADGTRAVDGAMVYAYVDAEGTVLAMPTPPVAAGGMNVLGDGGTPSGSHCEFAWLATVADALAAEDGDLVGLKNKRIVAEGTDLNSQ